MQPSPKYGCLSGSTPHRGPAAFGGLPAVLPSLLGWGWPCRACRARQSGSWRSRWLRRIVAEAVAQVEHSRGYRS
jgi:hypothetical protein